MIEEVTLLVTLLRQLPWIATRQVLEDNVWQRCLLIAPLSVIILHETGQHMTMRDLRTKLGAMDIINGA